MSAFALNHKNATFLFYDTLLIHNKGKMMTTAYFESNDNDIFVPYGSTIKNMNMGFKNSSFMKQFKSLYNVSNKLDVLYVEDDKPCQKEVSSLLEDLFNDVEVASDGLEGIDRYFKYMNEKNKNFDLIISDIHMANMNGIEFCKTILQSNPEQKIIVVSGDRDTDNLIKLINIGVDGFLEKPFEKKIVLETLYLTCNKIIQSYKNKAEVLLNDNFIWHDDTKVLTQGETTVNLCSKETILLDLLMTNRNLTFTVDDIFNAIYDEDFEKELSVDSVKSLLKRVRKKIPANLIKNIYGIGYKINNNLIISID